MKIPGFSDQSGHGVSSRSVDPPLFFGPKTLNSFVGSLSIVAY